MIGIPSEVGSCLMPNVPGIHRDPDQNKVLTEVTDDLIRNCMTLFLNTSLQKYFSLVLL